MKSLQRRHRKFKTVSSGGGGEQVKYIPFVHTKIKCSENSRRDWSKLSTSLLRTPKSSALRTAEVKTDCSKKGVLFAQK
ncbi:unnamed protein product [Acanthoscelides obtectus]|uniref:Uncharacterized protein n=1 Tax=Acanthoscelides obtectus TaxID=200917 RepID=A0A9P0M2T6_ACAOB|nr:unnamed protein product [Acanthoscelides obtectus]CAK1633362.1 hypothetical protein AOBTE_LOCUS8074 [Acanthoscelides obtectus]